MAYIEDSNTVHGYGATREHRKEFSAEALLKKLMDAAPNPHDWEERNGIKDEIVTILHSEDGQKYIDTVIEGWFQNAYRRLLQDYSNGDIASSRKATQEAAKAKQTEIEQTIETVINKRAQLKLLDLIMSNGKALRDCTGKECKQLSTKTSGWLNKIAARVKPGQLVGTVLSEADVRKLYN